VLAAAGCGNATRREIGLDGDAIFHVVSHTIWPGSIWGTTLELASHIASTSVGFHWPAVPWAASAMHRRDFMVAIR
jgi:hypothetical protein